MNSKSHRLKNSYKGKIHTLNAPELQGAGDNIRALREHVFPIEFIT